jgi:hypothetical protein
MPAGAPYGNRNAEKWTFKKAIRLFHDAIELSNKKETYYLKVADKAVEVDGYVFDFIGEIARELGTFKEIFSHLSKRFKSLERLHCQLISNVESNCYYNGKKGNIKEASALMNLKANHRWTDRMDNTSKDEKLQQPQIIISKPENIDILNDFLKKE